MLFIKRSYSFKSYLFVIDYCCFFIFCLQNTLWFHHYYYYCSSCIYKKVAHCFSRVNHSASSKCIFTNLLFTSAAPHCHFYSLGLKQKWETRLFAEQQVYRYILHLITSVSSFRVPPQNFPVPLWIRSEQMSGMRAQFQIKALSGMQVIKWWRWSKGLLGEGFVSLLKFSHRFFFAPLKRGGDSSLLLCWTK